MRKTYSQSPGPLCRCLTQVEARSKGVSLLSLPGAASPCLPGGWGPCLRGTRHEAHLPAQQHQAEAQPWLSRPDEDPQRPRGPLAPSGQGSSAPRADRSDQGHLTLPRLGLPRSVRLVASSDFRRIQGDGRRVRTADLVVLYLPTQAALARVGLTVSRKVGGSVVRNRVKRRLREAVRQQRDQLGERFDVVIIARPSAAQISAAALLEQVAGSFRRIGQSERHAAR